jgi:maltose alpha-D-glucosyltransferase/alpha-amylase
MRDLWYKNAIVYCLDVETFQDSNDDGVGDFRGLSDRLDYLVGLGITCIWLLPFYPSPNRDNGYDVVDYYNVDACFGSLGDFVEFMYQAREHGIRVVIDLVVNHTSDQHPWFQEACQNRDSPYYDYYVWSQAKPPDADEGVVFPGVQDSTWTYNAQADAYYFHRFYAHQPDLNIANPAVREEICKIMGFWLELGVSGFRVDAAPFLIELKGIRDAPDVDPYHYLWEFREFLSWRRGDAILLAEANVSPDKLSMYFGESGPHPAKLHMLFNFLVNQQMFLSLAHQQATPLHKHMQAVPDIPSAAQWANFLRNHDELDLGRLSDAERQQVFAAFAPDPTMRLYERGIRRRLSPMLNNDQRRLELVHSLLLSLPGTPVLRYGQEIGMGDNLALDERTSIRTPMQWLNTHNGGFSAAPPEKLVRPMIAEGDYGFERVNVAEQRHRPDSLLNVIERMIRLRKELPAFGWGAWSMIETNNPAVLAHSCTWHDETVIATHNFAAEPQHIVLTLPQVTGLIDLLGNEQYTADAAHQYRLDVPGYGYAWLRAAA